MIVDEIRERPILFSGPMIKAIFAGRKTQTRRVVLPQPKPDGDYWIWQSNKLDAGYCHTQREAMQRLMAGVCPYGRPGDTLWVRETWARTRVLGRPWYAYRAADTRTDYGGPWKPAIHMPREACRLRLHIKAVRAERLHDITFDDAMAEGMPDYRKLIESECQHGETADRCARRLEWPQREYRLLWDQLNAERGFGWKENPFVYVVEFVPL